MTTIATEPVLERRTGAGQTPLSRVVGVEMRKMFDTRAGFWLVASIGIAGLLATIATVLFAPDADLTYDTFATAVGFPMTIILPMISLLAITLPESLANRTTCRDRPRGRAARVLSGHSSSGTAHGRSSSAGSGAAAVICSERSGGARVVMGSMLSPLRALRRAPA